MRPDVVQKRTRSISRLARSPPGRTPDRCYRRVSLLPEKIFLPSVTHVAYIKWDICNISNRETRNSHHGSRVGGNGCRVEPIAGRGQRHRGRPRTEAAVDPGHGADAIAATGQERRRGAAVRRKALPLQPAYLEGRMRPAGERLVP